MLDRTHHILRKGVIPKKGICSECYCKPGEKTFCSDAKFRRINCRFAKQVHVAPALVLSATGRTLTTPDKSLLAAGRNVPIKLRVMLKGTDVECHGVGVLIFVLSRGAMGV
jgi:hypothetical protein